MLVAEGDVNAAVGDVFVAVALLTGVVLLCRCGAARTDVPLPNHHRQMTIIPSTTMRMPGGLPLGCRGPNINHWTNLLLIVLQYQL